jgi:hypothetical protein
MSYPSFADISRTFAPGWFAAVMGTGVLALTTHGLAQRWPWLAPLAEGLRRTISYAEKELTDKVYTELTWAEMN